MRVLIENISKQFGSIAVLEGIGFEVKAHELFFLLGPSGCGKTTLLRLIAGFYQPDTGAIFIGDARVNDMPPHRRNTGMVFQNYALWPHLSVAQNVAYGLEVRHVKGAEKDNRVRDALEIVRMQDYADRMPNQLSGGQQQRVALARALVIEPSVLLLDEPLSNLDAKLRLEMREEIRRIHAQTRITTIYVTHDQKEALSMADRIALLHKGKLQQVGDARNVYRNPANVFVAEFMGETNWLDGRVEKAQVGQVAVVKTGQGVFRVDTESQLFEGQEVKIGFRPESVQIGPAESNALMTRIRHVTYLGEVEQYELELGDGFNFKAFEQNPLHIRRVGDSLPIHIRSADFLLLRKE